MNSVRFVLVAALAAFTLVAVGCGGDDEGTDGNTETITETSDTTETSASSGTVLHGTVGPGFDISMTSANGQELATISPGSYVLEVEDLSSIHNFHLTGPGGGDVSTSVEEEGTQSFDVELEPGTYTFVCDPHSSTMNGSFEVSG
jgi:plastocyanin